MAGPRAGTTPDKVTITSIVDAGRRRLLAAFITVEVEVGPEARHILLATPSNAL